MRWYYRNASRGEHKDFFITGPSGSGYTYRSRLLPARLGAYLDRLNACMRAAPT